MFEVKVSNAACGHLRFALRTIALTDPAAAKECIKQIVLSLKALEQGNLNAFYFFNVHGIKENKYHQMLIDKRFLAIFYLDGQSVYVDYILDLHTEYEWLAE